MPMSSVLALISKTVFEKIAPKGVKVGDLVVSRSYLSKHKTFGALNDGGAIFLVTVRPPEERLWLVGILENPTFQNDGWYGDENRTPIVDITSAIPKLVFSTGHGLTVKKGSLGMSLQTPRVLTDDDVRLLRELGGSPSVAATSTVRSDTSGVGRHDDLLRLRAENYRAAVPLAKLEAKEKLQLEEFIETIEQQAEFGGI